MIENTTSQARAEWPSSATTPQRVRKRRDSRVAYHHNPKYYHRNVSIPSASVSPPRDSISRPSVQIHQQSLQGQANDFNGFNFWDLQRSPAENQDQLPFDQMVQRDGQADISWQAPMISYNYPNIPPNSPLSPNNNTPSPKVEQAPMSTHHALNISWDAPVLNGAGFNPDVDAGFTSDSDYGRFGSFDSMDVSSASTMASSISESYVMPGSNAGVDSPGGKMQLEDLSLDEYFQTMQAYDPSASNNGNQIMPTSPAIQEPFPIDNDFSGMQDWTGVASMSMYNNEMVQWSAATITQSPPLQGFHFGQSTTSTQIPWSQDATSFHENANPGNVAFEPPQGPGYGAYLLGQEFLDIRQRDITPQPAVSPTGDDSDYDGWQTVTYPSYANSSIPSQGSPQSAGSPFEMIDTPHQTPSPRPLHNDHQHVFTLYPGVTKQTPKLPRGRQRALTTKEKKEAREVREAKACWACHLSKIKCSPCSPGSPYYLMGHFTKANVEQFISKNAKAWGTHEMRIRMMWGYKEPIEVVVVGLDIHPDSELGINRQTIADRTHVQKVSPPVGIPLAAMDDMQEEYRRLVHNIVEDNLKHYLPIPYDDQDSMFSERLLRSLGDLYCASKTAGTEFEMLRQALEIHVTSTILERSLILDDDSMHTVETYFHTKYPKRSAARCATRQVKLAFFEVQQKRIMKVLESWGSMMWTNNKGTSTDKKWAISFSVFLALILSIDKTLGLAYYFCEGRIANRGYAASSERKRFQELVRLTQAELFERCKEIYHSSFKTRKNGKEACNPIRDGMAAFKDRSVAEPIEDFVQELRSIAREFGKPPQSIFNI
ncbi:hypothetical protein D0Z07_3228 [Hyphodiscus hymeniophilus]|uniref:Uncharacterized protein n=1 Tax=Hyphodiscus hymeniophilus TaxID=353542 RepID=A0A9P7AYJ1_9HELO|nr:hypothetical protein D0Z07_3228 [Hyphodiscus hymeniophilus]